ncbi:hypothetical protein XU18_5247 [Perkinsela sp. CCAP 1560/4]|nr:hypothetical protein XU18_5247 [Perkinsela sp. CCAP 1560/4]|eukprot:KNH00526.1 hypothetical protein XU18_5247 [Perkinsela sp. CCAP 1560/4]
MGWSRLFGDLTALPPGPVKLGLGSNHQTAPVNITCLGNCIMEIDLTYDRIPAIPKYLGLMVGHDTKSVRPIRAKNYIVHKSMHGNFLTVYFEMEFIIGSSMHVITKKQHISQCFE